MGVHLFDFDIMLVHLTQLAHIYRAVVGDGSDRIVRTGFGCGGFRCGVGCAHGYQGILKETRQYPMIACYQVYLVMV